ncbi:NAD(P)-dependent oxidoreductase [Candidatus Merdisoma sp. JLR.KK006]|uniref:NAD-dependent epimerase/dehydratase family protein n=1 Tax=Candidatus Merdisoma sp. JLR.KK006 TaxID=3112626 RepID=UPI002FF0CF75
MKTVVITGPTGAIGTALMGNFIEKGIHVYAVVRKDSSRLERIPESPLITPVLLGLDELQGLKNQISVSCDVFYHFAWAGTIGDGRNDVYLQNQNVKYTLDAVRAAAELGCKRFVGAGSQAEYGRTEGLLSPDTPAFPENGYGMAKLCAGHMSRLLCEQLGIEHVWGRILSVYGPRDGAKTMIMSAIDSFLRDRCPRFTKGEQLWDYLYSKDAAQAMYLLGEKGVNGKVYCLGSGHARPLAEYITILRNSIDSALKMELGAVPYSPKQVMYLCADIKTLREDTGFEPEYSFEQGIKETIAWYREEMGK